MKVSNQIKHHRSVSRWYRPNAPLQWQSMNQSNQLFAYEESAKQPL